MIPFPDIDPNIIEIGPLKVRWYGLMYVAGFIASYILIPRQERAKGIGLNGPTLQNLIFFIAIGLIIGSRLGYLLFYQFSNLGAYLNNPLEIIATWHGGMSFHGGLIGAIAGGYLFCARKGLPFWQTADSVIVTAPVGLFFGRIGNFINGELFGRPSAVPWAMVFPMGGPLPRHPSQLYEAALEGVLLFLGLWLLRNRIRKQGVMVCLFLGGYGTMRFFAEFFRQPDPQIGFLWGILSMGQILCISMVLAAFLLWVLLPDESSVSPPDRA